jgi:hypothetical protein
MAKAAAPKVDLSKLLSGKPTFAQAPQKAPVQPISSKPAPQPLFGGPNSMPLDQAIYTKRVRDDEREVLEQLGWKDGDPIPGNLARVLKEAQADVRDARRSARENLTPGLPLDTPPLVMEDPIPIEDLPWEKQLELRQMLEDTKHSEVKEKHTESLLIPAAGPGVNEAIRVAANAEPAVVVDDVSTMPKVPVASVPETPAATLATPPAYCVQCGHDQGIKEVIEVTELDKRAFLAAILGGVNFEKEFSLLGEQMRLVVRALSPDEIEACFRQVQTEYGRGDLKSDFDRMEAYHRYQVALQVREYVTPTARVELPEDLSGYELPRASANTEILPLVSRNFMNNVVKTASAYRVVDKAVTNFNRLLQRLEENAINPDFYGPMQPAG